MFLDFVRPAPIFEFRPAGAVGCGTAPARGADIESGHGMYLPDREPPAAGRGAAHGAIVTRAVVIVVSHQLPDHLDLHTIGRLQFGQSPLWFELGAVVRRHFNDHAMRLQLEELA